MQQKVQIQNTASSTATAANTIALCTVVCMRTLRLHVNLMVLTEPSSCILKLMHVHMCCGCSSVATLLCAKCICPALIGALDHNHHRHFDDYFFYDYCYYQFVVLLRLYSFVSGIY